MGIEKIGKKFGAFASVTAKKAGEQAQIARLNLDAAGLEKEIDGVYMAMGRYCYTKAKAGDSMSAEVMEYCADIDSLHMQIASIRKEIAFHKSERDGVAYSTAQEASEMEFEVEPDSAQAEGDVENPQSSENEKSAK
ncbi:MAG: hypothetical protein RR135_02175 [Oscillospiraceae bacterium]